MSRCPCRHSDGRQCLLDAGHAESHLLLPHEPERLCQAYLTVQDRLSHLPASEIAQRLNDEVLSMMHRESDGMTIDEKVAYGLDWYQSAVLGSLAPDECAGEA